MTRHAIKVVRLICKMSQIKKKNVWNFQNTVIILYEVCSVRKLAVNMKKLLIYLYCIKGQRLNSVLEKAKLKVLLFKKTKEFEFHDNLIKCLKDFWQNEKPESQLPLQ